MLDRFDVGLVHVCDGQTDRRQNCDRNWCMCEVTGTLLMLRSVVVIHKLWSVWYSGGRLWSSQVHVSS